MKYSPIIACPNKHIIKSDLQDVFEFLTCVLSHDKSVRNTVKLDNEEYSLTCKL